MVSCLAARRLAACALPRPSATASAALANSTVSHSQTATDQLKTLGSLTARPVVRSDPTHTTKMTGER